MKQLKLKEFHDFIENCLPMKRTEVELNKIPFLRDHENLDSFLLHIENSIPRLNSLDSIKDKKILILGEEGYGDSILLWRYIKDMSSLCKEIHILLSDPINLLFQEDLNNSNIHNVVLHSTLDHTNFDYWIWLFDLFYLYKDRILTKKRYLKIQQEKKNARWGQGKNRTCFREYRTRYRPLRPQRPYIPCKTLAKRKFCLV